MGEALGKELKAVDIRGGGTIPVVLLCMFVITFLTESGENYRWMLGFVLMLGYLPDNLAEILHVLAMRFKSVITQAPQLTVAPHNEK